MLEEDGCLKSSSNRDSFSRSTIYSVHLKKKKKEKKRNSKKLFNESKSQVFPAKFCVRV